MRAMGGRPVLMQRFPRAPAARRSSRSAFRTARRTGCRPRRSRPSTARRRARWWRRTRRTWHGRSTSPAWVSTSGLIAPTTPTTRTSCAWTSIRSRAPASPRRARPPGSSRRCWTSSASPASRRRPATAGCTSMSGWSRAGTPTPCAPPPWPRRASSSAAAATSSPPRGGRRSAAGGSSSTTTRTPRTRRSSAHGRSAPARAHRSRPRCAGRSSTTCEPDDLTLASVPGRLERDGDPWAAIDDAPQSLEPLLALHERDRANGLLDAPWPPVYPKQPDEPPRVAPSRARRQD